MGNVSEKRKNPGGTGSEPHTEAQWRAIEAFLGGANQLQAAAAAGVSDRSVRNWLTCPDFLAALREARAAQWTESTSLLQAATREAVETLQRVMRSGDSEAAQVAACRVLLDRAIKAVEVDDLAARLAAFEARLEEVARGNGNGHSPPR